MAKERLCLTGESEEEELKLGSPEFVQVASVDPLAKLQEELAESLCIESSIPLRMAKTLC